MIRESAGERHLFQYDSWARQDRVVVESCCDTPHFGSKVQPLPVCNQGDSGQPGFRDCRRSQRELHSYMRLADQSRIVTGLSAPELTEGYES